MSKGLDSLGHAPPAQRGLVGSQQAELAGLVAACVTQRVFPWLLGRLPALLGESAPKSAILATNPGRAECLSLQALQNSPHHPQPMTAREDDNITVTSPNRGAWPPRGSVLGPLATPLGSPRVFVLLCLVSNVHYIPSTDLNAVGGDKSSRLPAAF